METEVPPVGRDTTVRRYIQDSLVPYLDSLAKEVCEAHKRDEQPQTWLCDPDADDYQKPPKDGNP
jgi:hypothetical protein